MKVITQMRLESLASSSSKSVSNWLGGNMLTSEAKRQGYDYFYYTPSIEKNVTTGDEIPDVFVQGSGEYNRKSVCHGKLPEVWGSIEPETARREIAEQNPIPKGVGVSFGSMPLHRDRSSDTYSPIRGTLVLPNSEGYDIWHMEGRYDNYNGGRVICYCPYGYRVVLGEQKYTVYTNRVVGETVQEPCRGADSALEVFEWSWYALFAHEKEGWKYYNAYWYSQNAIAIWYQPKPFLYQDLFHEAYNMLWDRKPDSNRFEFKWLTQHAFMEACQDIGKASDNMLQNIKEAGNFLLGILDGSTLENLLEQRNSFYDFTHAQKFREMDKTFLSTTTGSTWLAYRYQYQTTKSDYEQFKKYILTATDRYFKFLDKGYWEHSHGVAQYTIDGVAVTCRCSIAWRPRTIYGLKYAMKQLHQYGLEVNPYVLWDSIPFSFVVDWFAPIGDVAEVMSDAKWYTEDYYDFDYVCFSMSYQMKDQGHRYFRWYDAPPLVEGYCWFDRGDKKTPKKTVVKRVLDTGAIVNGIISSKL